MDHVSRSWVAKTGYSLGKLINRFPRLRGTFKLIWDFFGVVFTYWFAFVLRFDGSVPEPFVAVFLRTLPILMILCLLVFIVFRNFSGLWTYFSMDDLVRLGLGVTVAMVVFAIIIFSHPLSEFVGYPRSVLVLEFILLGVWLASGRMGARYFKRYRGVEAHFGETGLERMLLIGRLTEADLVIRESKQKGIGEVIGVLDEDFETQNAYIHGVKVFHRKVTEIGSLVEKIKPDSILLLPPYNRPRQINELMAQVAETDVKCKFRTIPSLGDLAAGNLSANSIRGVDIEDLLDRGQITLDRTEVRRFLKGKTVMITGAGGSIGSELSRQVAFYEPQTLVLFEQSEFGLYSIEQELLRKYPNLHLIATAGDVRRADDVERAFAEAGRVDVVYHAAAYKHVPLMEKNVPACFRTNVLGTACLSKIAVKNGVDRFVMISSDKAVRPSSIMGATKRLAERVLNEMDCGSTTVVSVRFGNVLGSSGSVVPLFKQQIQNGGPVTVTSEKMRRFFMMIPEAVDLVLQAGTVGRNQEIMVLEMGEEIKIIDLARRLIELSGLTPDEDIKIEVSGLRPGEKEYEEVITEDENVVKTAYEKIWVMTKKGTTVTSGQLSLDEVRELISHGNTPGLRAFAAREVPENCFKQDI